MKENEPEHFAMPAAEEAHQYSVQELQDRYMSFEEYIARRDEKLGGDVE